MQQVSEILAFWRHRTSVRLVFETQNRIPQTHIPFQGSIRILGVYVRVNVGKIALSARSELTRYATLGFELVEKLPG